MKLTKFLSSMRLICNACIMAAACILLATCSSSEPDLGDITGRVTNDEDQPIQGADVEILGGGGATKTDAQGHYEFLSIGPGTYRVQVSKANYKTEEKSVTVEIGKAKALDFTLHPAKQKLSLSTKAVDFETEATTKIVTVTNAGMADLNWQLTEQVDWLTCTPTSGIIKPGKSESVTFRADRTKVLVGTWNDKVVFASDGGSEEVTVSITVPSISVRWEPAEMNFGDIETVMDLRLSGGSNVSYTLTPSNSWIIPSKNEGVFSKTENLRVSVRREGLAEGSYDGYLTLRVGAEQAYIPVRMNIRTREMPIVNMMQVKDVNDHAATFLGAVVSIGSSKVLHLHGELMKIRSMRRDDRIYDLTPDNLETSTETLDKYGDHVRPHIVFFNEDVPNITRAIELAGEADIFVVIGTSLNVYPAASLLHFVNAGTPICYIDPHPAHVEVPNLTVIAKKATEGVAELLGILSVRG